MRDAPAPSKRGHGDHPGPPRHPEEKRLDQIQNDLLVRLGKGCEWEWDGFFHDSDKISSFPTRRFSKMNEDEWIHLRVEFKSSGHG